MDLPMFSFVEATGQDPETSLSSGRQNRAAELERLRSIAAETVLDRTIAAIDRSPADQWLGEGTTFLFDTRVLSDGGRKCLMSGGEELPAHLLVRFDSAWWEAEIRRLGDVFGLSDVETELLGELCSHGDMELAAENTGRRRTSLRNALSRVRAKTGTRNVPELVSQSLVLLVPPAPQMRDRLDEILAQIFDLGPAMFAVLKAVADGTPRQQVAARSGRSLSSVKAMLGHAFFELGVQSAAEAACVVGQARILAEYLLADGARIVGAEQHLAQRVLEQVGGRSVAYSCYGAGNGPVAFLMHSTITCRHPPTRWVRAMMRGGWRVVAVDRPGFGGTSTASCDDMDAHVAAAADDMRAVLAAEGLESFVLVSRGAGLAAIAVAHILRSDITRVLLVNPTPAISHSSVDRGPLGAIKRRFARNPSSIRLIIGLLLRLSTPQRLVDAMRRAFASSPSDLAGLDDPVMVEDYLAATAPLAENLDGYVVENVAWARGWEPAAIAPLPPCSAIFGSDFVLHQPAESTQYFQSLIPDLEISRISGAGQMAMYTHADHVAATVISGE